MAKVGKFCLAKRVKVEWLFHPETANQSAFHVQQLQQSAGAD